jgi:hypothetical protein
LTDLAEDWTSERLALLQNADADILPVLLWKRQGGECPSENQLMPSSHSQLCVVLLVQENKLKPYVDPCLFEPSKNIDMLHISEYKMLRGYKTVFNSKVTDFGRHLIAIIGLLSKM